MNPEVTFETAGALGVINLDRPDALNALTEDMVNAITRQLALWHCDTAIDAVVVRAVPGRAFCAGGDIRHVAEAVSASGVSAIEPFFAQEYRMNWRIHSYSKPYISLIDGIVMGGGVGLSVHGQYRIMTERALFAMPETGIGMFPDVGGSYFLPRLPGRLGYLLGLSGRSLTGADCVAAGIGTHFVPSSDLPALFDRLAAVRDGSYEDVLRAASQSFSALDDLIAEADDLFAHADLNVMLEKIGRKDAELMADLGKKSPFALAVTKRQLDQGSSRDFQSCMRMEFDMVRRVLAFPDFGEGVRALIIDKDKQPRWRYKQIADVPADEVGRVFEPMMPALQFSWDAA